MWPTKTTKTNIVSSCGVWPVYLFLCFYFFGLLMVSSMIFAFFVFSLAVRRTCCSNNNKSVMMKEHTSGSRAIIRLCIVISFSPTINISYKWKFFRARNVPISFSLLLLCTDWRFIFSLSFCGSFILNLRIHGCRVGAQILHV